MYFNYKIIVNYIKHELIQTLFGIVYRPSQKKLNPTVGFVWLIYHCEQ